MSYSRDEQILKKILRTIINSTAGLIHVLIVDDTGITILSESKFHFRDNAATVEKIGAIGSAVFIANEEQGHILGYGRIGIQITEYQGGMIFSAKTGNGILCIATDPNVQIGFIRAILKKYAPIVSKVLKTYLKQDQEAISKEIKDILSEDLSS